MIQLNGDDVRTRHDILDVAQHKVIDDLTHARGEARDVQNVAVIDVCRIHLACGQSTQNQPNGKHKKKWSDFNSIIYKGKGYIWKKYTF